MVYFIKHKCRGSKDKENGLLANAFWKKWDKGHVNFLTLRVWKQTIKAKKVDYILKGLNMLLLTRWNSRELIDTIMTY